jgi:hypothetical protein
MANIWASGTYFLVVSTILMFIFDGSRQPWMIVESQDHQVYAELRLGTYTVCQSNNKNLSLCITENWEYNPYYYLFYLSFVLTALLFFFLYSNFTLEHPPSLPRSKKAFGIYLVMIMIPMILLVLVMEKSGSVGWIILAQDWIVFHMPNSTSSTTYHYDIMVQIYVMLSIITMLCDSIGSNIRQARERQQIVPEVVPAGPESQSVSVLPEERSHVIEINLIPKNAVKSDSEQVL